MPVKYKGILIITVPFRQHFLAIVISNNNNIWHLHSLSVDEIQSSGLVIQRTRHRHTGQIM